MTSGACRSISFFSRLLRLMTRRYRSFRSEVAKRPPSSGTSGRSSGGITGITSRIIHCGLLPLLRKASTTFRRLAYFSRFCSEVSVRIFSRSSTGERLDFHPLQQFLDGFGAHHGLEAGGAVLLVELAELGFVLDDLALFDRSFAGLDDHVGLEVQHRLQVAQRDVQHVPDAAGQALEEPDVRAGRSQLNVAQPFAAHLGERDFHAALVADHAAVLHALVLAAQALPVGYRAENAGAEQAVALRLEGAVVDRFRLGDFAVRPAADLLRRSQADADGVEIGDGFPRSNGLERYIISSSIVVVGCQFSNATVNAAATGRLSNCLTARLAAKGHAFRRAVTLPVTAGFSR